MRLGVCGAPSSEDRPPCRGVGGVGRVLALARLAAGGPAGGGGEAPVAHWEKEKEKEKENLGGDVSPRPRRVHLLLGVCVWVGVGDVGGGGLLMENLSPCRQPATTEGGK